MMRWGWVVLPVFIMNAVMGMTMKPVRGEIEFKRGVLKLGAGAECEIANLKLGGDYWVEFSCCKERRDGWVGLVFNKDLGEGLLLYLMDRNFAVFDRNRGINLVRFFPPVSPTHGEVRIKLCVYASQRRITYYVNGNFYGERLLWNEKDPKLVGGAIGFATHMTEARVWGIEYGPITERSRVPIYRPVVYEARDPFLFPHSPKPARTVYYAKIKRMPPEVKFLIVALQGIVNRRKPQIFTDLGFYEMMDVGQDWAGLLGDRFRIIEVEGEDFDDLVWEFKPFVDGAVIYDEEAWDNISYPERTHQINVATTIAGARDVLPMTWELRKYLEDKRDLKFSVRWDLRSDRKDAISQYRYAMLRFWRWCNHRIIAHLEPQEYTIPLRDYLVANKIFTFYASDVETEDDYRFYEELLAFTPPNTPIIGSTSLVRRFGPPHSVFDEDTMFRLAGELGKFFVYTHSAGNLSFHSGMRVEELRQKRDYKYHKLDEGKVYICFIASDGDNLTWAMNLRAIAFGQKAGRAIPKGWGVPLAMVDMCPDVLAYYYEHAEPGEYFFADGAGIGDCYGLEDYGIRLAMDRKQLLDEFMELTQNYMAKADIQVIHPFDTAHKISEGLLALYARKMQNLVAIYTGYNGEPGGVSYERANFIVEGVPVFRTLVGSGAPRSDEENARVLVEGIRQATPSIRPGFMNVFVLGNYLIRSCRVLELVMAELGDEYVAVRPDEMGYLYMMWRRKLEERHRK